MSPINVVDETDSIENAQRRAFWARAATATWTVTASALVLRRGAEVGFKNLFKSVYAPKDALYMGMLYGAGDISQQCITQYKSSTRDPDEHLSINWLGAATAATVGCSFSGPFNHFWLKFLEKKLVGTSARIVIKKVIWDQLTLPIPLTMFFTSMAVIKAKTDVFADLKDKLLSAMIAGSIFWPTAQFFNFKFVPQSNRILYISIVGFIWSNGMCFLKDRETKPRD